MTGLAKTHPVYMQGSLIVISEQEEMTNKHA